MPTAKVRRKDPERFNREARERYKKNRDKIRRGRRLGYESTEEYKLAAFSRCLKTRYGMTIQEYEKKLVEQRGVCAICKRLCNSGRRLAVDHEHATKKNRGLLCAKCNLMLGGSDESATTLLLAVQYLEFWEKEHSKSLSPTGLVERGGVNGVLLSGVVGQNGSDDVEVR